jgi:hypothetical protein
MSRIESHEECHKNAAVPRKHAAAQPVVAVRPLTLERDPQDRPNNLCGSVKG